MYWLDADVMIQAKNTLYSFSIAKPFWDFLDEQAELGIVHSSVKVYGEIMSYEDQKDELVKWCKSRKLTLFRHPDKSVQEIYTSVADHVAQTYPKRQAKVADFLKGGDGWIIAHAKHSRGIVVTNENRRDATALVPKIPNVCHAFGIGCVNLPAMLTKLDFKFGK
jgi:hypothetical protein